MKLVLKKVYDKLFREVTDLKKESVRLNTFISSITTCFDMLCFISEDPAPSQKLGNLREILIEKGKLTYSEDDDCYYFDEKLELIFVFEKMIARGI